MRILVAFASRGGSTRAVGEAIARKLRAAGYAVDVRSADEVADLAAYDAVVLGSAIYDQAWLPEAREFVRRGVHLLAERPVWLFSVGSISSAQGWPLGALAEREPREIADLWKAIHPRDYHVFAGVIDPTRFSSIGQWVLRALTGRRNDLRDWDEIEAWAARIALGLASSEATATAVPARR